MNYGSEKERGKAFPIHVEMGDDGPIIDLGERGDAVNLPKSGCVLVDYEKNEDGSLRIKTVCLPAPGAESEEDGVDDEYAEDLESALGNEPKMKEKPGVELADEDEEDDD